MTASILKAVSFFGFVQKLGETVRLGGVIEDKQLKSFVFCLHGF